MTYQEELHNALNYFLTLDNFPQQTPLNLMSHMFPECSDDIEKIKKEEKDKSRLRIYEIINKMGITTIEDLIEEL